MEDGMDVGDFLTDAVSAMVEISWTLMNSKVESTDEDHGFRCSLGSKWKEIEMSEL